MSKPLIYKSWAEELWYCTDYLYCGKGDTPKAAYDEWMKKEEKHYVLVSIPRPPRQWDIPFTQETIYPPKHKPLLWKYQDNPKEDYSDLVWYKRWWKRFADIWKGD